MFKYNFENFKTRMLWYVRQLLPLKYSFEGEVKNPEEGFWRAASCT